MTAFAKFTDNLNTDTGWQEFWMSALANPSGDWLQNSLLQEIPGL